MNGGDLPNIALSGHSGAGKSTVAEHLRSKHKYHICKTGRACRAICEMLFGSQSKSYLNAVTDKLREIDPTVWLRVAISDAPSDGLIVVDSIRFAEDYTYLRSRGFSIWRIDTDLAVRTHRLLGRGQVFNPAVDDIHPAEAELDDIEFDVRIDNTLHDNEELLARVDEELERIRRYRAQRMSPIKPSSPGEEQPAFRPAPTP